MANILIVDDDPLVMEALTAALARRGHYLTCARNGLEGLQKFALGTFDLVISDIIMPGEEGLGLIMKIRSLSPSARIIAISGGGRTGNVEFLRIARDLGASATIEKPIRFENLISTVEGVLSVNYVADKSAAAISG